ncbi:hypothetical protein ACFYZB_21115 [Streptomyces sp. NPDC001852]|uniref:hypothetical protein n=1 Tax=Streptomyces sp. NPDC001852 TaxID=3364619 RepID=UPI0036C1C25A
MTDQALEATIGLCRLAPGPGTDRPWREVCVRDRDVQAHALIEGFFALGLSLAGESVDRWRAGGELDRTTVSQIRVWMANRTLASFAPGGSEAVRTRLVAERTALERWLTDRGFVRPA